MHVSDAIRKVHKLSGVPHYLTAGRYRKLRYNLRCAGIVDEVIAEEEQLALSILRQYYLRVGGFRDDEKYKNLKPMDVLHVFHGTPRFRLPMLFNGFDATKIKSRDYNGPKHRGLFVTLDLDLAKRFSGHGVVLELEVRAKNLHGTDFSGTIGRKRKELGQYDDKLEDMYPNSFRPYLSATLLQNGEPQALLVGLVAPRQIKRVFSHDSGEKWKEYATREEYLTSEARDQSQDPRQKEYIVEDAGIDLSSPKIKLEDFAYMLGKHIGKSTEKVKEVLVFRYKMGDDKLQDLLMHSISFGGSKLGPLAVDSLVKQVAELAWNNET